MSSLKKYIHLISRALNRNTILKYSEKHHIIPKCIIKNNWVVDLSLAEHILAHKYLADITKHPKLIQAYYFMTSIHGEKVSIKKNN